MHQEVKQQWVTALRSGEYAQGNGHLRKDDEYCCLGVLCDIAVKAAVTHGRQRRGHVSVRGIRAGAKVLPSR